MLALDKHDISDAHSGRDDSMAYQKQKDAPWRATENSYQHQNREFGYVDCTLAARRAREAVRALIAMAARGSWGS
jgi:hypothetical protein